MAENEVKGSPFVDDPGMYGKKIENIPKPKRDFGIDTEDTLFWDLAAVDATTSVDMSEINKFTNISDNRNELYSLID